MAVELTSLEPLEAIVGARPFAILTDIDGTVAPIVPHPELAHITERACDAIHELIERDVRMAFVTGRALEMARQMVNTPGAYFAANHGINILMDDVIYTPEEVRPFVQWAQDVIEEVCKVDIPGVIVEDKGPVVAFHYRMAASESQAFAALEVALRNAETAKHFRIQQGRKVLELRPPLELDKGTAVTALAEHMGAKGVLCMGDDATDLDMFRGVEELRAKGIPAASIAVWSPEIAPEVLEATDYWVSGVEGIEWLLEELIKVLPRP